MSQGAQPPISQELVATLGQRLLGHVRNLDGGESAEQASDQTIDCLRTLIALASRQGILQNDVKMAESLLMATTTSTSRQHASGKKRRTDDDHDGDSAQSTTLPAQLVMTAILRILARKGTTVIDNNADQALLVTMAATLIRAVSQHARGSNNSLPICVQAECQWLQGSTKSLLSALSQVMVKLVADLQQTSLDDDMETCEALSSCLYANADLINLAGTRLSRSQAILSVLENTAWDAMACSRHFTDITAVSTLLAILPLAGGTERSTPASLWTSHLQNVQGLLGKLLEKSVPLSERVVKSIQQYSTSMEQRLEDWWRTLQMIESQEDRVALVLHLVRSLVSLLVALVQQGQSNLVLLEATLNIPSLLDLVDALLSVPMSAEATYYGTKKRLRDEPLDSGVLTPTSVATMIANHLHMEGQRLLSNLVTLVGRPSLMPYAQRLRQVGYAGVLTSCSPTLRQVLEPGYNVAKKRRWLPHSIVTRTSALRTLKILTVSLGVKATSSRRTKSRVSGQEMDQIVKVVAGCLLEQLYPHDDADCDWGSIEERLDLISMAADCLSSMLVCGGEFLSMEARQLIDSLAATCLSYIRQPSSTAASLRSNQLCKSFLELGKSCVTISWPDGAASSLRDALRQAAPSVVGSGDSSLEQVAASARQLCDTLSNPSVPALHVVTRQNADPPLAEELSAKIEQARADAKAQRKRADDEEQTRKKAKLDKKEKKLDKQAAATTTDAASTSKTAADAPATTAEASSTDADAAAKPTTLQNGEFESGAIKDYDNKTKESPIVIHKQEPSATQALQKHDSKSMPEIKPDAKLPLPPRGMPKDDDDSDLDEDFPMIVDAGPDEEDVNDDA